MVDYIVLNICDYIDTTIPFYFFFFVVVVDSEFRLLGVGVPALRECYETAESMLVILALLICAVRWKGRVSTLP